MSPVSAQAPARRRLAAVFASVGLALGAQAALATTIVVGQVAPLSGLEASQGRAYAAGMRLCFAAAGKAGVNGHTFKLVQQDDGGRPEDTVTATRTLLAEARPMVLAGFFGSRNLADLVASGTLEKERIALVGYRTSEVQPPTPYLFNVRAGLREEIQKLTEHLATIGITRIGLFYEDSPAAPALLAVAEEAARKARATFVARASYPAGTARVGPAAETFLKAAPQAIIMVSSGGAAAGFIEQFRASGGAAQLFAHSGADIEQLSRRLSEEQMQGVAIAQVTPSPYRISSRLAKELIELAGKATDLDQPVGYAMMEGCIAAKVIAEAVRRQGARPTREGLLAALESFDHDVGGYLVSYRPDHRNGSRFVELSIVSSSGRIRQ